MVSSSNDGVGDGNNRSKKDSLASLFKSMGGGNDCDRPACDDTKSALTAALQRVGQQTTGNGASSSTYKKQNAIEKEPTSYTGCPPTRDDIGASTWSLLHSMVCVA